MGRKARAGDKTWYRTKRSTTVVDDATEYSCTYHSTTVFRLDKRTGAVTLRDGGFDTVTTRSRINDCALALGLDLGIYRDKGRTFVSCNGVTYPFDGALHCEPEAWAYEPYDGMAIRFLWESGTFVLVLDSKTGKLASGVFTSFAAALEHAREINRFAGSEVRCAE